MNSCYKKDEWQIIEEGFHPEKNRESESIFSLGNGYMGQRANFEEHYSGDYHRGSYIAGVYYPDKTRVGWWKNGYPEYFAKVLNSPNWIGIDISVDGINIDLAEVKINTFKRVLNMKEGFLQREFSITISDGKNLRISSKRFLSMAEPDLGIIRYSVIPENFTGTVRFTVYLDADVRNEDTNYGQKFWKEINREAIAGKGIITVRTMKTNFHVALGMKYLLLKDNMPLGVKPDVIDKPKYIANILSADAKPGEELVLYKFVSVISSLNHAKKDLSSVVNNRLDHAIKSGYNKLLADHIGEWERIWSTSDVIIKGDISAQQAIRFNIFQLNQTYTGKDERLNIGPKGFTGEKYGGSTYWDTEAFVLPFFLKTAPKEVARNLLIYRYKHLDKSIENAAKLGFKDGAALYPMVTMNGEECHNEWEITFEEIHRNGAIAFAIFNYIRHTGDIEYMTSHGLDVLIGISRFWSQRTTFSQDKGKYVILGVTGPNEYENNVNNNWYTNTLAVWTLAYTLENLELLRKKSDPEFKDLITKTKLDLATETKRWKELIDKMHFPYYEKGEIFLQQDGFLDKEIIPATSIAESERPINQNWSWDRILRSCYIKQADVLQGLYLFDHKFDNATMKRNFDFYESITVHESSLSACIHSILASRIGKVDKAYDLYLRTARLDLDDYNNEVDDGLHITSMAGSWLAIVEGFGGMRVIDDRVHLNPLIPDQWESYCFNARFRGIQFEVKVTGKEVVIQNLSDKILPVTVFEKDLQVKASGQLAVRIEGK